MVSKRNDGMTNGHSATALVLAGGKSRRMKTNKALLPLEGSLLIERILVQLRPRFSEILLCVSKEKQYDFLGFPQVVDDKPFQGPLGAILTGLRASKNPVNFAIACDIPEINPELMKHMFAFTESYDIVVPTTGFGKYEPLFAFYNTNTIPAIENLLAERQRRLSLLFSLCRTCYVRMDDASWYFNLNTVEDVKRYQYYSARKKRRPSSTETPQMSL